MNQDRDDIACLRVENTPKPVKVEVRRVAPPIGMSAATVQEQVRIQAMMNARMAAMQATLTGIGRPIGLFGQAFGGSY